MSTQALVDERLRYWRRDPAGAIQFVRDQFDVEPDPDQCAALVSYQKNPRTAMKASKGTGKTCTLAWCAWHFLTVYQDCNVAATSITSDNLRDGLWKEMAVWQAKSPFLQRAFHWGKERIESVYRPATWWMAARTWSKSANAQAQSETLAGLHAKYILFLIDEAGGMPRPIMATAEAALTSGATDDNVAKIGVGGNPTNLEGVLYDCCVSEAWLWSVISMTGDPDNPKRSPRVSIQWARDQIQKYGRNSPWVKVNVFGEFPESSLNTLLGPDDVQEAINRKLTVDEYEWAQKRLGVDVARYGDDLTVIFPRQGLRAFLPAIMSHPRGSPVSTDIAGRVMMAKRKFGSELEFFDSTGGWAAGARDILHQAGQSPISVLYSAPSMDKRYKNVRAQIWIEGTNWVKNGGKLPPVPELLAEMTTPTYSYVGGQFVIEPKDLVKERLGRSPNYTDALFETFFLPDMPAAQSPLGRMIAVREAGRRSENDFDPMTQSADPSGDFDPLRDDRI